MIVKLTPLEMRLAAMVGVEREIDALANNRRLTYGADPALVFANHIIGAFGEYAVAKVLRSAWGSTMPDYQGDVGSVHIRTTAHPRGNLILHPADRAEDPHILVRGNLDSWELMGWCYGWEGQQERYWRDFGNNRPAFFVPVSALRKIDDDAIALLKEFTT